jgi:glycosyltransferase involved in cell wall biosynthesis
MSDEMPIRILFVLTSNVRGGVEAVVLSLLSRLDRSEFEPALAAPPRLLSALEKDLASHHVPTFPAAASSWFDLRQVRALARAVRSFRPHIVNPHFFRSALVAAPLAKYLSVPCVIETYHLREAWRRGCLRGNFLLDRVVASQIDGIIAVSEASKRFLVNAKQLPASKISVVPNGCDLSAFTPGCGGLAARRELGFEPSTLVIGIFGRLEAQKGHKYALSALAELAPRWPALRLLVVGDGSLRGVLERQVRNLGLYDRVVFTGFRCDVPRLLDAVDVVVLPSLYEGMPLASIEAAAMAKPIVATAVDGTTEVVVDGETGSLVQPADVAGLARATDELLANAPLRQEWGQRARRRAASCFSLTRHVTLTAEAYRSRLGRHRPINDHRASPQ